MQLQALLFFHECGHFKDCFPILPPGRDEKSSARRAATAASAFSPRGGSSCSQPSSKVRPRLDVEAPGAKPQPDDESDQSTPPWPTTRSRQWDRRPSDEDTTAWPSEEELNLDCSVASEAEAFRKVRTPKQDEEEQAIAARPDDLLVPGVPEGCSPMAEERAEATKRPGVEPAPWNGSTSREAVAEGSPAEPMARVDLPPAHAAAEESQAIDAEVIPGGAEKGHEAGDIVVLGPGAPPEFRQCRAVVTKVDQTFCTVVVLDESGRFGVGECWPMLADLQTVSRALRLGGRVLIDGLKGAKTRRLNGSFGTIAAHPKQGHPTFVSAKASQEEPHLTVCVRLDDPPAGAERSVLLEPRFLVDGARLLEQAACELGDALVTLRAFDAGAGLPIA